MELVYHNEKKLFVIALVLSIIFWIAIIVGTIGIALIYLLLGFIVYLFAHSAFISYLKGTGVKISEAQYPDLYKRLEYCCQKVGLTTVPDAYLLRTDFFNALATRFLGRHFIVLFTDVVDALEKQPGAVNFYLGHEIGHVHRNHLKWGWFLFPALLLPVLGTAYRRAEEYTCDRYGTLCCEQDMDVIAAIAAIAAGDSRWKGINPNAYVKQAAATSGFWMSFHELTGDYPWLTKRMARAIALRKNKKIKLPRRHLMAWLLSLFIPRLGTNGGASLLVMIVIIGMLAAIGLPAYKQYEQRMMQNLGLPDLSMHKDAGKPEKKAVPNSGAAYRSALLVKERMNEYFREHQDWPGSLRDLGFEIDIIANESLGFEVSVYEEGVIAAYVGADDNGDGQFVVLEPGVAGGDLFWRCYGDNLPESLLPVDCK